MDTKRTRRNAAEFDRELLELYDQYVHSQISRRQFLSRATRFSVAGVTAAALLDMLNPDYALATQVDPSDSAVITEGISYSSPEGSGKVNGYLARPAATDGKLPGVLVIHENRGLNPYIEDVARRLGVAGFLALAPDALTPLGGYPGNDDDGRAMQRKLDREKMTEDFIAAARHLEKHPVCTGKVGVVGFCFGGGMANTLAWRIPDVIDAAAPFYGRQPEARAVPLIKAELLLHYAEHDERVNAGWPACEDALTASGVKYEAHVYPGTNHGFHNDTTPRYDEEAARLAWERTIAFFIRTLR